MCRCTGYVKIVDAVREAAAELRGDKNTVASPEGTGLRGRRNDDGYDTVLGGFKGQRPPRAGKGESK